MQAAYIIELGMAESRVFKGYDVVDNAYFASMARLRQSTERLNRLPNCNYFLASSRFLPQKNLQRLLEAFAAYSRLAKPQGWELVLLGDGDLRPELERQRIRLGLESVVHMPGFMQYGDLPDYYAWAGAFIHASTTEQWGLVVNEAILPTARRDECTSTVAPSGIAVGRCRCWYRSVVAVPPIWSKMAATGSRLTRTM